MWSVLCLILPCFCGREDDVKGVLSYCTALFDESSMQRLGRHLGNLLAAAATRPSAPLSELSLMDADEQRTVLHTFNDTAGPVPMLCIHHFFEQQAAATPAAACLISADGSSCLTYAEVNAAANQLARHLASAGVGAEAPVTVMMDKCFEAYIALIAILKAGGCYVPIDHTMPAARVSDILQQSGAKLLLVTRTTAGIESQLPRVGILVAGSCWRQFSDLPGNNLEPRSRPNNAVYLMFTSGALRGPQLHRSVSRMPVSPRSGFVSLSHMTHHSMQLMV